MAGDQLARFRATEPCDGIRDTLVDAGWIAPNDRSREVALGYVWNASFLLYLNHRDRYVRVHVVPEEGHAWLLSITCFDRGREPAGLVGSHRVRVPADTPPDPVTPVAAYEVALVLHGYLSTVAQDLTWACDRPPSQSDFHDAPVPPDGPA